MKLRVSSKILNLFYIHILHVFVFIYNIRNCIMQLKVVIFYRLLIYNSNIRCRPSIKTNRNIKKQGIHFTTIFSHDKNVLASRTVAMFPICKYETIYYSTNCDAFVDNAHLSALQKMHIFTPQNVLKFSFQYYFISLLKALASIPTTGSRSSFEVLYVV